MTRSARHAPRTLRERAPALWRLLWTSVALFVFTSCAQEGTPTLTLWHSYRGAEQDALLAVVDAFEREHADVEVDVVPVPYDIYANKITSGVPRGNGPDVFVFAQERTGAWASADIVAPLDEALPASAFEGLPERMVDAFRYEGALYGLPLSTKTIALYYRSDLLAEIGFEPPETTDELVAAARAFTDRDAGRFGLVYQNTDFYFHSGWFFGFGGALETADGEPTLWSEGARRSLEFIDVLQNEHEVIPSDVTGALVTELFNSGRALFAVNGPWFLGELGEDVSFGVVPLPVVSATGEPARPFVTVEGVLMTTQVDPEMADEAAALVAFLAGPESARIRAEVGRQNVVHAAVLEDADAEQDAVIATFSRAAVEGTPMPNRPEMGAMWEPANRALREVARGGADVERALREADDELQIALAPPPPGASGVPYLIFFALVVVGAGVATVRRARATNLVARMREAKHAYRYVLPAAVGCILLIFLPFFVGATLSLYAHESGEFTFVGFANFIRILASQDFGITHPQNFYFTLLVTVMWTFLNVALHVGIGLWLALLLRDEWVKLKGVYRVLLIVPWAVPNYITALIWKGMFNAEFGAINALLGVFGLEAVDWFSQFATAFAANLITNTWLGFPFMMVVSLGALQSIPRDLEDAAAVDGATRWQRFRHITLPLLRPALLPAIILGSVWTFNMFNIIYLVSGGEPDSSSDILITEAYRWAFERQERYGYAAAYGVLIFGALVMYTWLTSGGARRRGGRT